MALGASGCATRTAAAKGVPRDQLAELVIPRWMESDYNGWFLSFFELSIDGETFDDPGRYLVTEGRHQVRISCGLFAPGGMPVFEAKAGQRYRAGMSGFGGSASWIWIGLVGPDGALVNDQAVDVEPWNERFVDLGEWWGVQHLGPTPMIDEIVVFELLRGDVPWWERPVFGNELDQGNDVEGFFDAPDRHRPLDAIDWFGDEGPDDPDVAAPP